MDRAVIGESPAQGFNSLSCLVMALVVDSDAISGKD
jgi:hypothetical protein